MGSTLHLYNRQMYYDIESGQCTAFSLSISTLNMSVFLIPPFATFVDNEVVNSVNCEHWRVENFYQTSDYWVSFNIVDGKSVYYPVRITFSEFSDGGFATFDYKFKNVIIAPQDDALFTIWKEDGCPENTRSKTNTVTGYTRNALSGRVVGGVQLIAKYGTSAMKLVSDSNGLFTIKQVPLNSNLLLTTEGFNNQGYYATSQNISNIIGPINAGTVSDLFLTPIVKPGQLRLVLSWGYTPIDLDAHLIMPNGCETKYNNIRCETPQGISQFEKDINQGFGVETITISLAPNASGEFKYFVYNFKNQVPFNMDANVKIYNAQGLMKQVSIANGNYSTLDRYWNVLKIVLNGSVDIQVVNTVSQTILNK